MNKRKIALLAMSACMIAILAIGGTLAYFTDTENEINVFTVGNLDITLIEEQRDENGGLEDFEDDKPLFPIVGSAQGEKDALGLPVAKNYVDKVITIKNEEVSGNAWVRAFFAIPSALDDGYDTFNAGANVLHFNFGTDLAGESTDGKDWTWTHGDKWNYFETTIDEIKYNVYFADYNTILEPEETTSRLVNGVYLDASFNWDEDGYFYTNPKTKQKEYLQLDAAWDWENVQCPVYAVAVQAEGFDNANAAVEAAFGAQYNPWGTAVSNWQ